jgi:hypothetical protein
MYGLTQILNFLFNIISPILNKIFSIISFSEYEKQSIIIDFHNHQILFHKIAMDF